jgi:DHA1 family inner membrane transport protein
MAAFVIGSTEFVVPGILPEIANGLHISITTAGFLVSGYALGVVVGAPAVTVVVVRFPRKPVLLGLLGFSVAGNVASAVAGSYGTLMGGRVLASLCHGAFFGVASVVAADLVAPERKASAIAGMFMGITLANLIGVPIGAYIGQHLGWRVAFLTIAATGAVSVLGVAWFVPPTGEGQARSVRGEARAFNNPQIWLALAMTAFGFGAVYCPLTYVVPLMTSVAGFPRSAVSLLLVLFGAGLTLGNVVGAWAADRRLMASLQIVLIGLVAVLAAFAETAHERVGAAVTLFLVGFFAYATVPGFTARVINMAGASGATLASSAAVAAFNLGNAAGAYLGGVALSLGHSAAGTSWAGAAMAAVGLSVAVVSVALEKRQAAASAAARA